MQRRRRARAWIGGLAVAGMMGAGEPASAAETADAAVPAETAAAAVPAIAADAADAAGEAGAARGPLAWEAMYRADLLANVAGGLQRRGTALGNLDLRATADFDRAWGWAGATAYLHVLASQGGKPNAHYVGSSQGVDNIEVAVNTAKVFQAWVQQQFLDERMSVLAGLYDLNSEFYATQASGLFLHPPAGIGPEFAQTGRNGPSIFPTSSLGLRVKAKLGANGYAQAVVLDGVPGDPDNPRGTQVRLRRDDGVLAVAEFGHVREGMAGSEGAPAPNPAKLAAGYWWYSTPFTVLDRSGHAGEPLRARVNHGVYALAERPLGEDVAGFLRAGWANGDINPYTGYLHAGVVWTGLLPGRGADQFGVSAALARRGGAWLDAMRAAGEDADRHELSLELTYRFVAAPWLAVQPLVQHIVHPGTNPQVKDATVVGVRLEFSLGR